LTYRQAWRFWLNVFCTVAANNIVVMFLSLYLKSRNVDNMHIGGLLGTYYLAMPLVVLGFGLLADRISCRSLIMLGSIVSIFDCLVMPQVHNVYLMAFFIALGGIGVALSFITVNVLFLKTLREEERGKNLSIFVAATVAGYSLGSALCSVLIRELPLPVETIFYTAAPLHAVAFLAAIGLPEAPIERFPVIKYFHDTKRIPVFLVALVSFSLGAHAGSEGFSIVRFLDEEIGARGFQIALFFILTGVSMSVFSRISGHLVDTQGNLVKILVPALAVSGLFQALTNWVHTFPQFLLMRILHTCGDGAILFSVPMLISLVFAASRMGGNYGFNQTIKKYRNRYGEHGFRLPRGTIYAGDSFCGDGRVPDRRGGRCLDDARLLARREGGVSHRERIHPCLAVDRATAGIATGSE
jgi:MFS family permease